MNKIRLENFTRFVENTNFRFLEAMEDLVRIRDANGEILFENIAMRKVIQDLLIKNTKVNNSTEVFIDLYRREKEKNQTIEDEINIDNNIYNVKISPVLNQGEVEGYIEVYRDISEERKVKNLLIDAQDKMRSDIKLAKNIQKSILPKKNIFKNIYFQFAHLPSEDLSGDLFDVVEIDNDKIGVYIADVVGHGISASIMTMFIRQSMRRILQENHDFGPEETILELKQMFQQLDLDISQYFSIIYFLIDTREKKIRYVNAGHNTYPILFNDKKIALLQNKGKLISNLFTNVKYNEKCIDLIDNDRVLMYTDGLVETTNYQGQYFDENLLIRWIRKNKEEKNIVHKLIRHVDAFRFMEQKDDVAILYFEVRS